MGVGFDYVVVVSEDDPVARLVGERWGTPPAAGAHVDGAPIRSLSGSVGLLRRAGLHIHDDALFVGGPGSEAPGPTLVFPSVHRSASEKPTLTVHPLGNPGPTAEVGGRPGVLVPTDPRRMTAALRGLREPADRLGWAVSYEATHHGPALGQPAFFVEIGAPDFAHPPALAVDALAELIPRLEPDPRDRIALGLGGGHYAPHFTDLAFERQWAFGHLLPRYLLPGLPSERIAQASALTHACEGILYHRSEDVGAFAAPPGLLRLKDGDAPKRETP